MEFKNFRSLSLIIVVGALLTACNMEYGSEVGNIPPADFPHYHPWPPETPSSRIRIDQDFSPPLGSGKSLLEVGNLLSRALRDAAYYESSFYWVPGGFAMVTRLEAIDTNGTPLSDENRYRLPDDEHNFDFVEFVRSLFFAPEGYYRFIVFVVSDVRYVPSTETLTESEATTRLERGATGLPQNYAYRPFSEYHRIDALIYEFRKGIHDGDIETLRPGRLPPQTHLQSSGLYQALFEPVAP